MNYTGSKVKLSRGLGIALTPKAARVMEKKANPPGMHGAKQVMRRKVSDYSKQLKEKQKLRAQYNVHERQLRNYVARASRRTGKTGDVLVQIMETRLDAVVLRAGFARTIYAARQYVNHGHILVDGKKVDLPAYEVKPGQKISLKQSSRQMPDIQVALAEANVPSYVAVNRNDFSAELMRIPYRDEVPVLCDVQLVVEYYSR